MRQLYTVFSLFLALFLYHATSAQAQDAGAKPSAPPAQDANTPPPNPGRELVLAKCAQCHTDSMWHDQCQDARAWEAILYRIVGRGALWSGDEIKTMAAFLSTDFGPNIPRKPAAH